MPFIKIREGNRERTIPYGEFEEEIKPGWKAIMGAEWGAKNHASR